MKNKNTAIFNILIPIYFVFAFLERSVFDFGANIEILTSAMVLSSYYLGGRKTFLFTLFVIALSDLIIGNTNIFIFTWSGFLIPAFMISGLKFRKLIRNYTSNKQQVTSDKCFKSVFLRLPPTTHRLPALLCKPLQAGVALRAGVITLVLGLSANLFFYLWTNFGVWLLDSWGMYSKDLSGLTLCYINGLPFLRNQMVSSMILIPLFTAVFEVIGKLNFQYKFTDKLQVISNK